jgi:hypothetical protein
MRSRLLLRCVLAALAVLAPLAVADYVATSPIEGNVCSGFILESCKFYRVSAVKGSDGQLHSINTRYDSVSEFDESKRRCWIHTKSKGGGLWSWGANMALQPEFYTTTESNEYEKIDVEYITFSCVQHK